MGKRVSFLLAMAFYVACVAMPDRGVLDSLDFSASPRELETLCLSLISDNMPETAHAVIERMHNAPGCREMIMVENEYNKAFRPYLCLQERCMFDCFKRTLSWLEVRDCPKTAKAYLESVMPFRDRIPDGWWQSMERLAARPEGSRYAFPDVRMDSCRIGNAFLRWQEKMNGSVLSMDNDSGMKESICGLVDIEISPVKCGPRNMFILEGSKFRPLGGSGQFYRERYFSVLDLNGGIIEVFDIGAYLNVNNDLLVNIYITNTDEYGFDVKVDFQVVAALMHSQAFGGYPGVSIQMPGYGLASRIEFSKLRDIKRRESLRQKSPSS